MTLLPLEAEFRDYVSTEKIAYLPRKLNVGGPSGRENISGDFAYYAPWGNLAVFYKGIAAEDGRLIVLGPIESGKDALARQSEAFTVRIE